ncbi:MAG TPA: NifU family protein [Candidatus Rhabdochlamydia sp.]|jgi:NifU-like protein|nr:NifU family protein [Candidatus Rhabdochlamydia sp.]
MIENHPWTQYSKRLVQKIEKPLYVGAFSLVEAQAKGMRLAIGTQGNDQLGQWIKIYLLVDESDGVIADAKFQMFGPSCLIGALEAACEVLMRKNYHQAALLSVDLIDKQVRDKSQTPAFPESAFSYLNLVIDAIENAVESCRDIVLPDNYVPTPLNSLHSQEEYPGWKELSHEQKIAVLDMVIANDIRPYIELDAGGIEIKELTLDNQVVIAYQGACTSCPSAIGSTLQAIEGILQAKVYAGLSVKPDLSLLNY